MAKHRKHIPGMTRQGVKDLSYIKAPPRKKLELPPSMGMQCDHNGSIREDHMSGCTHCTRCNSGWDFDGRPI
jgi:hypothetical protein